MEVASSFKTLPLYVYDEVVAHTLVDDDVYEWAEFERWRLTSNGYAVQSGKWAQAQQLHRLVLGLERGDPRFTDHINRDKLDNRRANLRVVTSQQNAENREISTRRSSPFRGVSLHPSGKWYATVMVNDGAHRLGTYISEEIAAIAAELGRRRYLTHALPDSMLHARGLLEVVTDNLVCVRCGDHTEAIRDARYWQLLEDGFVCEPCSGWVRAMQRLRPIQAPKTCPNCKRLAPRLKLGRCDSCYAYFRNHARESPATHLRKTQL